MAYLHRNHSVLRISCPDQLGDQDKSTKAPSIHSVAVDGKQLEQAAFTVDQSEVTLVSLGLVAGCGWWM